MEKLIIAKTFKGVVATLSGKAVKAGGAVKRSDFDSRQLKRLRKSNVIVESTQIKNTAPKKAPVKSPKRAATKEA